MKKAFLPATVVPGAEPVRDQFGRHERDRKGRPLWRMPRPIRSEMRLQMVKEVQEIDGKPRLVLVKKPVRFPVFKGTSAAQARYDRALRKRMHRTLAALEALGG